MAYTYDQFIKAANDAGVMDRFSKDDLNVAQTNPEYGLSIVGLLGDISNATTTEQRLLATEAANQLRKIYGLYGTGQTYAGSFGSQIGQTMDKLTNYGSFAYGQQNEYQKLLDSVANPGSFSYDPESDSSFQSYKKAYLREGERASANALAQASAASGGVPSSFAVNAAQQAGNYYAGQLADAIPTLEQNAYQRYLNDYNNKLSGLSALQSDRAFDYQKYLDGYSQLQSNLGSLQTQDEIDYKRYLDQVAEKQQQFENALTLYNQLGYATPEIAAILGIDSSNAGSEPQVGTPYVGDPLLGSGDGDGNGEGDGGTSTLSAAGQNFMANLPYAYAGSNPETWKRVVDERLTQAYSNGVLSETDVVNIMTQLGLYDLTGGTTAASDNSDRTNGKTNSGNTGRTNKTGNTRKTVGSLQRVNISNRDNVLK